jgi:hypothetical protein
MKTTPTATTVETFLSAVEPETRREEGHRLDAIFRSATGWEPRMWGPSIVGYGRYRYTYDSGRTGEMCATGFSPRKAELSVYILPGYADFGPILADLGKHRLGKSCLYLRRLSDVDEAVLARLIRAGIDDLAKRWPVTPE